jgi:hypothetical protein
MTALFAGPEKGGISLGMLRVPIGVSDFSVVQGYLRFVVASEHDQICQEILYILK